MASAADRITWQDIVIFWAKVLVMCLILGTISFYIGRRYLGTRFSEGEIREGAPEIVVQVPGSGADLEETEKAPPAKAKVEIEEREASEAEAARANREFVEADEEADVERDAADASSQDEEDESEAEGTSNWSDYTSEETDSGQADDNAQETESSEDSHYVVIAGSFLNPENSQRTLQELKSKGYQPYITKVTIGDKTYRRVNVAAFASRQQADKLAEELANAGYEVTVGVR